MYSVRGKLEMDIDLNYGNGNLILKQNSVYSGKKF
jgi:hypothetical protein